MSNTGFVSFLVLFSTMTISVSGAAADRSPAGFGNGEKQLDKLIVFPEVSTNVDKTFICQGILKSNGRMTHSNCYLIEPRDSPYIVAINKAAKKARFTPASVGGKNVGVYLLYTVQFIRKDDEQRIVLYSNQGYLENLDAYGPVHVQAQRSLTRELWESICPNRNRFAVCPDARRRGWSAKQHQSDACERDSD